MGPEIFLFAAVQTDTDVRPHFCPKCSRGLFNVGTAAGVWYEPLTHIWYQRLENNRAVPLQTSHSGYSATTFSVLLL